MRRHDFISSLFWLLIGLGFASGGFYYGFGSWRDPGPGLLPVVFGMLLSVLSAGLLGMTLKAKKEAGTGTFSATEESWKAIGCTLFSLVAYMVILRQAGFILTTFLFTFFLLRFVGGKRWRISLLVALVFSIVCYGLFSSLLGTPLPKGRIYGSPVGLAARV